MVAGCDTIRWNFTRGLNDTRGAAFVLNVGFQQSAGSLQQISADSISKAAIMTPHAVHLDNSLLPSPKQLTLTLSSSFCQSCTSTLSTASQSSLACARAGNFTGGPQAHQPQNSLLHVMQVIVANLIANELCHDLAVAVVTCANSAEHLSMRRLHEFGVLTCRCWPAFRSSAWHWCRCGSLPETCP